MSEVEKKGILTLSVINVVALDVGNASQCYFDDSGGSIGCGNTDKWILTDRKKSSIHSKHMRVELSDKRFCIKEGTGDIYVNGSTMPLGKIQKTIIEDGDIFELGSYKVRANLGYGSSGDIPSPSKKNKKELGQYSLEEVVRGGDISHESEVLNQYMGSMQTNLSEGIQVGNAENIDDVLDSLYDKNSVSFKNDKAAYDPLSALDKQQEKQFKQNIMEQEMDDLTDIIKGNSMNDTTQTQADLSNTTAAAFSANTEQVGSDIEAELARMEVSAGSSPAKQEIQKVESGDMGAALSQLLGVDLPSDNSEQLTSAIQEMGETINQAVLGLRDLFEATNDISCSRLSSLKLHPLEDNPLRLGKSQSETLNTLYSGKKNPVYLSAGSAVEECMSILKQDQEATTVAIEEALGAILNALSPDTLIQRFSRYAVQKNYTDPDAWAWKMYKHYYSELMGNQKNGFNSLFHNIFSQAYDRNIRSLQK